MGHYTPPVASQTEAANKDHGRRLQQIPKLFQTYTGIPDNAAHRECIDRIMAWNRQDSHSIRHDNVYALAKYAKSGFLKHGDGSQMVDPWKLGHNLPQQYWINHPLPRYMCQGCMPSKPLQSIGLLVCTCMYLYVLV